MLQQPSAGCSAEAWTASIILEAGPAGPKPPCCLRPGRRPYDDPSVGSLQLYAAVTGDLISYRLQHLFPARSCTIIYRKCYKSFVASLELANLLCSFTMCYRNDSVVLELPGRHEILSPLSSQAPKLWSFKAFGDLFEVQPARSTRAGLITRVYIWFRYVREL